MHHSSGSIQPDAIGQPSIFVGIVRHDQRDFAVGGTGTTQTRPVGGKFDHELHPIAQRFVGGDGAFGRLVKERLTLEADRARQDAAVHFWQGHVHRDVAGREAG